jgi:hypothetical protein
MTVNDKKLYRVLTHSVFTGQITLLSTKLKNTNKEVLVLCIAHEPNDILDPIDNSPMIVTPVAILKNPKDLISKLQFPEGISAETFKYSNLVPKELIDYFNDNG